MDVDESGSGGRGGSKTNVNNLDMRGKDFPAALACRFGLSARLPLPKCERRLSLREKRLLFAIAPLRKAGNYWCC